MKRTLTFRLGGVRTHLAGLDESVRETLRRRFRRFLEEGAFDETPDLVISVRPAPLVRVGERTSLAPVRPAALPLSGAADGPRLESELQGDRILLRAPAFAGSFSLAGCEGEVLLRGSLREPPHKSIESFLHVALAWRLLLRNALLVRGVGVLGSQGKAIVYLSADELTGEERTRLAAGAPLLSDEYLILERQDGTLNAHALPASRETATLGAWPDRIPAYLEAGPTATSDDAPAAPVGRLLLQSADAPGPGPAGSAEQHTIAAILSAVPHVTSNPRGASRAITIIRGLIRNITVERAAWSSPAA